MTRRARVECLNFRFEDTPEGEFIETVFAAQGQLERQQNSRQVVQKMKARLEAGYHVFPAPIGYRFEKVAGHGKLLVRDEPVASVIQQALEGFASGVFQTQVEVQRFLESEPDYPKNKKGRVHPSRVKEILTHITYSGYVKHDDWNVSLRKGQHEGLVSLETFEKIQERLNGQAKAPARKDIRDDFPLRGFITCNDCDRPLTSCWAKGKYEKFAYYRCYNKDCPGPRKSIPRDTLEGEFEALLGCLKPTRDLFDLVTAMFKKAWDQQDKHAASVLISAKQKINAADKKIGQLLDRIMEASHPSVIAKYEERIAELEKEKLIMTEKLQNQAPPKGSFEDLFKLSLSFLANPCKLWAFGGLEHKRTVLKLAFKDRLAYCPKTGLQTPQKPRIFGLFSEFLTNESEMVGLSLTSSNRNCWRHSPIIVYKYSRFIMKLWLFSKGVRNERFSLFIKYRPVIFQGGLA